MSTRRLAIYVAVSLATLLMLWALIEGGERDLWSIPSASAQELWAVF